MIRNSVSMDYPIPPEFKLAFSAADIKERVNTLAEDVGAWAKEERTSTGQQVLAVCVVRGGVYFFADLLRALSVSVEPSFCRTWSYSSTDNTRSARDVRVSIGEIISENRSILLVDDICDTSTTLNKLESIFLQLGAKTVKSVVLIQREVESAPFTPHMGRV